MTRVSQADQVLLLLRERLQRLDRSRGARAGRASAGREATAPPLARLQAMGALDQLGEEDFRRIMVRALLAEELGEGVAGDPAFQTIVDDVYRIIGESPEGRALMDEVAGRLRDAG